MDIIKRNFLNLLRNGAFGEQLPIEAMSDFKWKVLLSVAKIHLVDNWVGDSLDKGLTVSGQSIPDAGASHLSNAWLNRKLMSIRENEPLSEDASIETLNMLDIIVQATQSIITYGFSLGYIIKIGQYIRQDGHKIDYIKLTKWLHDLHIFRMAQLEASILVDSLGFEADEIQYMEYMDKSAHTLVTYSIDHPLRIKADEWHVRQLSNGMIENNNKVMHQTIRNCHRYMQYAPMEAVSTLCVRFVASLSNLAE